MDNTVLLVVDVQNALVDSEPYAKSEFIDNITSLIDVCRKNSIEVVYVQHCDDNDDDFMENSKGWHILKDIEPTGDEKIFRKRYNSAFKETGLKAYLDSKCIHKIILIGMQTEYCIDTTCKVAFEYGYKIIMPHMANTTFDNGKIKAEDVCKHYYNIWNGRFADCTDMENIIDRIKDR